MPATPISIGIENLFPTESILMIEQENPQFIDITPPSSKRVRGENIFTDETKYVNKDEKGNMCNWFCTHGTENDFKNFKIIFQIIDQIVTG